MSLYQKNQNSMYSQRMVFATMSCPPENDDFPPRRSSRSHSGSIYPISMLSSPPASPPLTTPSFLRRLSDDHGPMMLPPGPIPNLVHDRRPPESKNLCKSVETSGPPAPPKNDPPSWMGKPKKHRKMSISTPISPSTGTDMIVDLYHSPIEKMDSLYMQDFADALPPKQENRDPIVMREPLKRRISQLAEHAHDPSQLKSTWSMKIHWLAEKMAI